MKTLYLELNMGAAGDMLTAALADLFDDPAEAVAALNALGVPGVSYALEPRVRCGVTGAGLKVTVNGAEEDEETLSGHHHDHDHGHDHDHEHHHHHSGLHEIEAVINGLNAPETVRENAVNVYRLLADAESRVHGVPVTDVHFHEVGTLDAVADIAGFCLLLHLLAPEKIVASPVRTGFGSVKCAHGVLPVPAPATARLLLGVPTESGAIEGELCTPTGAALVKTFASSFGPRPPMTVQRIGLGMGKKEFPAANCVRVFLGESAEEEGSDVIFELACNVDDMTAEALAFAAERVLAAGALDVFMTPVIMKKGRPGTLFTALCRGEDRDRLIKEIFRHTTTLGVRYVKKERAVLNRRVETVDTPLGPVHKKTAEGFGVTREKYEYDDLAALAEKNGISLADVVKGIVNEK
ncbi:MAG: nickel pincer cofactor biosynthesis protein LarC [Clostridia bacterium]|nr:nickel pincer cofactor biosynthesis protein LarC [Clostridia bacterium]